MDVEFDLELINIFDELSMINFSQDIQSQIMLLDEDLLQLNFESGSIIDAGWYPAFEAKGEFIINRIDNGCWDTPEFTCKVGWDKKQLVSMLRKAIN